VPGPVVPLGPVAVVGLVVVGTELEPGAGKLAPMSGGALERCTTRMPANPATLAATAGARLTVSYLGLLARGVSR